MVMVKLNKMTRRRYHHLSTWIYLLSISHSISSIKAFTSLSTSPSRPLSGNGISRIGGAGLEKKDGFNTFFPTKTNTPSLSFCNEQFKHRRRNNNHSLSSFTALFFQNRHYHNQGKPKYNASSSNNNQHKNNNNNQNSNQHNAHATNISPLPLPNTSDPFIILNISSNASKQEIKTAYKKLAMIYHPDTWIKASSTEEEKQRANDDFARINGAYADLMDSFEREEGYGTYGGYSSSSASASAVANGWADTKVNTHPYRGPQPGEEDQTTRTYQNAQHSKYGGTMDNDSSSGSGHSFNNNQAYKHYGGDDFHSKYTSANGSGSSASNFNYNDRERSERRQQDLKQHYEDLKSNRDKYKKYGGTSSNMGFYEAYNETETKSNDVYNVRVENKFKNGVNIRQNDGGPASVSDGTKFTTKGFGRVGARHDVDAGKTSYDEGLNGQRQQHHQQQPPPPQQPFQQVARPQTRPKPQKQPPININQPRQPQPPINNRQQRQQTVNVRQPQTTVNGQQRQVVNNRQQQKHSPVNGYHPQPPTVNGQRQVVNNRQPQQSSPVNEFRPHQQSSDDFVNGHQHQPPNHGQHKYTSRPGYGPPTNKHTQFFNNNNINNDKSNGASVHRARTNAKYRRQQQQHTAGMNYHHIDHPPQPHQQPPPNDFHQQAPQQQYQTTNPRYAQRQGYGTKINNNRVSTRGYQQTSQTFHNIQDDYRAHVNSVAPQQPQYQQHHVQHQQTPPPQQQRINNNQVSFEYKRKVYGGTSSDAQKKKKVDTFSRYSGTDLDNDFARRVRATAPSAPQSKYTGQGYGGTSTDAVSPTTGGRGVGGSKQTVRHGYGVGRRVQTAASAAPTSTTVSATAMNVDTPPKNVQPNSNAYGGTSAEAMNRNKKTQSNRGVNTSSNVGFTRRKYKNSGPQVETSPQNVASTHVNIKEPVQPQKNVEKTKVAQPPFTRQGFGGTSSPYVRNNNNNSKVASKPQTRAPTAGYRQKQTQYADDRRYGDFFDANKFHEQWNTSNPDPAKRAKRPGTSAQKGESWSKNTEMMTAEEEQRRYNEAVLEEARRRAQKLTEKLRVEEEEQRRQKRQKRPVSHLGSIEVGLSMAMNAVTSLFSNNDKSANRSSDSSPPVRNLQFSPYEACTMIEMHQRDPKKDKEKALQIMLRNRNVPVTRTELLSLYKKYKEGRVATNHTWERFDNRME